MTSTSRTAPLAALLALLLAGSAAAAEAPRPWVRKIVVHGAKQLSRPTLLGRLDLKTWRPLPDDPATSVPAQVAEAYARAGLPTPSVEVTVGAPDPRGATVVTLDLVETPLPRLESFSADLGGLPFPTNLSTLGKVVWFRLDGKLSRYNRKDLELGLRKEQRRLRGLGWKGATFEILEEEAAAGDARTVKVKLALGPREALKGQGIDRPVMKEVSGAWKRRNVPLSEGVVNRLARAAAEGMTERGYADVKVEPAETTKGGKRTIVLGATHGPRLAVETIRFEGAGSLPEKELRKAVRLHEPRLFRLSKTHPGPAALEEDRLALVDLYARSGFPDVKVEAAVEGEGERRAVVFRLEEGRRRTIGSLSFPGAKAIGAAEIRKITKLAEGQPYREDKDAEASEALRKEYARRGYDEATVTARAGEPDAEGRLPLALEGVEGTSYRTGGVSVRGNYKTRTKRILSLGDEKPGRPLDSGQLAEHQSRLSRLGVFDTVSVTSTRSAGSRWRGRSASGTSSGTR